MRIERKKGYIRVIIELKILKKVRISKKKEKKRIKVKERERERVLLK